MSGLFLPWTRKPVHPKEKKLPSEEIRQYIEKNLQPDEMNFAAPLMTFASEEPDLELSSSPDFSFATMPAAKESSACYETAPALDLRLKNLDESFQQMLFREIDRRGMTDVQCYRLAHMDRKTFSKIRGDVQYKPKKTTAVSLAIALKMSFDEAEAFLKKAGFAFSNSNIFDVIIRYYLENRQYDIIQINETLYYYDQPLLGAR